MNLPDGQALATIGAMGLAIFGVGRALVGSYIKLAERQTDILGKTLTEVSVTLKSVADDQQKHDTKSCEAHEKQCNALDEMTVSLKSMNGKKAG